MTQILNDYYVVMKGGVTLFWLRFVANSHADRHILSTKRKFPLISTIEGHMLNEWEYFIEAEVVNSFSDAKSSSHFKHKLNWKSVTMDTPFTNKQCQGDAFVDLANCNETLHWSACVTNATVLSADYIRILSCFISNLIRCCTPDRVMYTLLITILGDISH